MKQSQIDEIREFNRFYAKIIGVLDKTYLNSAYSLAEVRVLREISIQNNLTANDILLTLGLDKGYLSRILKSFEKKKFITKKRSTLDGRAFYLALTELGSIEFEKINSAVRNQVGQTFGNISADDYEILINSMKTIKNILTKQ